MTWAQQQRQAFIAKTLEEAGSIRRKHICAAFSVTILTASSDLRVYMAANPGAMRYDSSEAAYVRGS